MYSTSEKNFRLQCKYMGFLEPHVFVDLIKYGQNVLLSFFKNMYSHFNCISVHVSITIMHKEGSWKKRARRDPCDIRRQCQIICEFFQHIEQLRTIRCLQ